MEKYTIDFEFCNGNLSFVVNTNHIFMVENNDKKKSGKLFMKGKSLDAYPYIIIRKPKKFY